MCAVAGYNRSRAVSLLLGPVGADGVGSDVGGNKRCQLAGTWHSRHLSGVEAYLAGSTERLAVLVDNTSFSQWRWRWSWLLDCCQLLHRLYAGLAGLHTVFSLCYHNQLLYVKVPSHCSVALLSVSLIPSGAGNIAGLVFWSLSSTAKWLGEEKIEHTQWFSW